MGQVHENFNPFDKKNYTWFSYENVKMVLGNFSFHQDNGKKIWVGLHIK